MRIAKKALLPLVLALGAAASFFATPTAPVHAAEFDIDAERTILRRLQFCLDCGAALLVTRVHPGAIVRCPDCGREQPRLHDKYLLTQVYQICKLCQFPLDPEGHHPGETVECANCHTRQILSRDAFPTGENVAGLGYEPGFPPGSGRKNLAFATDSPGGNSVAVFPIGGSSPETLPTNRPEMPPGVKTIPQPPALAPLPDPSAALATSVAPAQPTTPDSAPPPAAPTPAPAPHVVDVPAVSVDMFGGKRPQSAARQEAAAAGGMSGTDAAAMVNGRPVRRAEVDRVLDAIMRRLAAQGVPEQEREERRAQLSREILDRLVDRELAFQEAAAIGHKPDSAAVAKREAELAAMFAGDGRNLRREAERDVVMADMRRRFGEKTAEISPEAVRDYYNQNKDKALRPRLTALKQLVVYEDRAGRVDRRSYRDIARDISAALEKGERFEDLRQRHDDFAPNADQPDEAPPLLPDDAYAAQILAAGGEMRKGAVFGPLFMEGMAVFCKVVDARPASPPPFKEVEKSIRLRLEAEQTEKNLDAWLKGLRRKATVEIAPTYN